MARLRAGLLLCLTSIGTFALADIGLRFEQLVPLFAVKLGQVALIAVALATLPAAARRGVAVGVAVAIVLAIDATTALSGVLSGDVATTPILLVVIVMATATVLPWGAWPQAATAVFAGVAAIWNAWAVGGMAALGYPTVGLAVAMPASIYVAHELERHRRERAAVATQLGEQTRVLGMIALGVPLHDVLATVCRLVEARDPRARCAIVLVDGGRLRLGAAPSVPRPWRRVLDDVPADGFAAPTAAALATGRPVAVTDVVTESRWGALCNRALQHGLRACWCVPIVSAHGGRLGVVAVHRVAPSAPGTLDWARLRAAADLARLAIEQRRTEESLCESVVAAAEAGEDVESALGHALERIAAATGWSFGQVWFPRPGEPVLEAGPSWCDGDPRLERLRAASAAAVYAPDVGLPGRVWASRRPVWLLDVTEEPGYLGREMAREAGIRSALGLPVLSRDEVVAVLEFAMVGVRDEDARLVNVCLRALARLGSLLERRRAERALRASEERFRSLIEHVSDVIAVVGRDGTVRYVSPSLERVVGWTPADVVGRRIADLARPERSEGLAPLAAGDWGPPGRARPVHFRLRHRDGSWRDMEATVTNLLAEPSVQGVVLSCRDITERRRLEVELRHAHKLEAVGRLAAGFAHELDAPLRLIGDTARRLAGAIAAEADGPALRSAVARGLDETLRAVERIAHLARVMKDFARADAPERTPADLNQAVLSAITVVRAELSRVADVETELVPLPPVVGDPADLTQVFLDLLVNAAHAVRAAAGASGRRGRIRVRTLREGDVVVVAIADTGPGIAAAIRDKVFDPGRAPGSGLAIARSIVVDRHGGQLTFETEVGTGTTFYVRLPVADPDAAAAA